MPANIFLFPIRAEQAQKKPPSQVGKTAHPLLVVWLSFHFQVTIPIYQMPVHSPRFPTIETGPESHPSASWMNAGHQQSGHG